MNFNWRILNSTQAILVCLLSVTLIGCSQSSGDDAVDEDGNCTFETVDLYNDINRSADMYNSSSRYSSSISSEYLTGTINACQKLNGLLGSKTCKAENLRSGELMYISYSSVSTTCSQAQSIRNSSSSSQATRPANPTVEQPTSSPAVSTEKINSRISSVVLTVKDSNSFRSLVSNAQQSEMIMVQAGQVIKNTELLSNSEGAICTYYYFGSMGRDLFFNGASISFNKIKYKEDHTQLALTDTYGDHILTCVYRNSLGRYYTEWDLSMLQKAFGSIVTFKVNR